jgi:hypothetical protein
MTVTRFDETRRPSAYFSAGRNVSVTRRGCARRRCHTSDVFSFWVTDLGVSYVDFWHSGAEKKCSSLDKLCEIFNKIIEQPSVTA